MTTLTNWINETPERRRTYEQERLIVDVAEAVQGLLDKAGMKRAELGRRTGIARQSLHQMLSGQQNLTLRTMATIAHELGYRVSVKFEPYSSQETRPECACTTDSALECSFRAMKECQCQCHHSEREIQHD